MQRGQQREDGSARGNGSHGNGSPGQRTLTMSLPPRRSSSDEDPSLSSNGSSSSDEDGDRERARAQRRLLDSAISPHLDDDDEEFFSVDDGEVEEADEQALFADHDGWSEVDAVEQETAERATQASPDDVHNGWSSTFFSGALYAGSALTSLFSSAYNRTLDFKGITERAREAIVAKLNAALNVTDAAVTNLRIDGGLITADAVTAGPLARSIAGYDVLCGGFTLRGLELTLAISDAIALYQQSGKRLSDSVTIRFGSLELPLLQIGTPQAQPSQAQPSQSPPSQSPQAQPSSDRSLPDLVRSLLAGLRLGVHLGSIDVLLHSQSDAGVICSATIANGALRVLPDSGAFKAVKQLTTKHIRVDGKRFTAAELREHVELLVELSGVGHEGPAFARRVAAIPAQIRAGLDEEGWSENDRAVLAAILAYIEGDTSAFTECDKANKERDTRKADSESKSATAQRERTAERIRELGDDVDTGGAAGHIHLADVHGGVVGSTFASDGQTRGRLHVGSAQVDGLATQVGGFQTTVDHGEVGPLDVRLLDDQLGVHLGGARVRGARGSRPDGTRANLTSLELGETRAAGRTGDILHPTQSVTASVHLGGMTAVGGGASGERSGNVRRAHVGPTELDVHKVDDDVRVDATGLATDLTGAAVAIDGETAVRAGDLHVGRSEVHASRTTYAGGVVTDGTVKLGDVDVDDLTAAKPMTGQHGKVGHVHVGGVTAGKHGHKLDAGVGDVSVTEAEARLGRDREAGLESFQLGATHAEATIGDLDKPTEAYDASLALGPVTVQGAGGTAGDRAVLAGNTYVGPTKVDVSQHDGTQRVDATGLAVNVTNLAGTLDEQTAISADSLRLAPSTVHGERKASSTPTGSASVGALDIDTLSLDRPRAQQHAGAQHLHVGGVTATSLDDQAFVTVDDLAADHVDARSGQQRLTVTSAGLDNATAGVNHADHSGHVGLGTVTAAQVDATSGGDGAMTGHADQITLHPTEATVGGELSTLHSDGVEVTGIHGGQGTTKVDAERVRTGVIEAEHEPRKIGGGVALDVRLGSLDAHEVHAHQTSGTVTTSTHVGDARLSELHGRAVDDGTAEAQLDRAGVSGVRWLRRDHDPEAPRATRQAWYTHEDKIDVEHAGIDHAEVAVPKGARDPGRRDLSITGVDVTNADMITRDHGDRHGHQVRKATYEYEKAKASADAERRIAERKAAEKEEAEKSAPRKKPGLARRALSKARKILPHGKDQAEKAEDTAESAEKRLEKVTEQQRKHAEKQDGDQTTKDRGAHRRAGDVHVDSFGAALSGFDHDTAHVDSTSLGHVSGHGLEEHKRFEQIDDLTAEVKDVDVMVDGEGNGTVKVHLHTGRHMLQNLMGHTKGAVANKLAHVNNKNFHLEIPVVGGVIQLDEIGLNIDKNWLLKKIGKFVSHLKIAGGTQGRAALHVPMVGDFQPEHLPFDAVERQDKPILVGDHGAGGVNVPNLLTGLLQWLSDRALGGPVAGLHDLQQASISELSIDGASYKHSSGAQARHRPTDLTDAKLGSASIGTSKAALDSTDTVRQLMASLASMLAGAQAGVTPDTSQPQSASPSQPQGTSKPPSPSTSTPKAQGSSKPASSNPVRRQPHAVLNQLLSSEDGLGQVAAFNTGGGGDCGIHAMFGVPTGASGTVRAANPSTQRKQLADHLDGSDGAGQAEVDREAFTQLFAELVLQILDQQGGVGLERRAFGAIDGFLDAMEDARSADDIDYKHHGALSDDYADHLLDDFVLGPDDDVGHALREQLIEDVMVSATESERELRQALERAGNGERRHIIILETARAHLRRLLLSNIDVMVTIASSFGHIPHTAPWVANDFLFLQHQHAQLGGNLRQAVAGYLDQLLVAYASVVRTQGYYLHDQDLRLLALLNDLDLHIYREHDQHDGEFVEQLTEPGTHRRDVFHSGAHYEKARHS